MHVKHYVPPLLISPNEMNYHDDTFWFRYTLQKILTSPDLYFFFQICHLEPVLQICRLSQPCRLCGRVNRTAESCQNPQYNQSTKALKETFCRLPGSQVGVQTSPVFTDLITPNSLQYWCYVKVFEIAIQFSKTKYNLVWMWKTMTLSKSHFNIVG